MNRGHQPQPAESVGSHVIAFWGAMRPEQPRRDVERHVTQPTLLQRMVRAITGVKR